MSTYIRKETTFGAAAHYALYLGLFWVFRYLFLISSEYSDLYLYIYNVLSIGTPILFYALACVYRDKRLGGVISFGKVVAFGVFLFLFASFLEAVVMAIHLIVINPNYLSNLQEEVYLFYDKMNMPASFMNTLEQGLSFGPMTYIMGQIFANMLSGLIISLIFGYFISRKTTKHKINQ